ncbi:hypothetical protein [Rhizobium sp. SG570]|uniref:hypothetical protein n=1 Tax=Rhizobium sp. SG570 TaxID=2587113 RepID=UPI0014461A78|nr:hypothetical protein [Rhizobium sp. SG570]NKJ37367.1 hypothetical protein [Rhizobium sp. SG570]
MMREFMKMLLSCQICLAILTFATPARFVRAQELEQCPVSAPNAPTPKISEKGLADVCIPTGFNGNPIDFFDDYSWRVFLGLVWPAKDEERGKPDPAAELGASGRPVVFETFKSDWEVFQPGGAAPSDWLEIGTNNPCGVKLEKGELVLAAFSKFENLAQAGFGNLVGPLIAQNRTYIRFETAFNENEFDKIFKDKLYLRSNLNNVVFDAGAIDIKASWLDMTGIGHPERFYTRDAYLLDLASETCSKKRVGLVGLHIVQKTASRPQWIWSSFEQVDNVADPHSLAPLTFNANDGVPMPKDENPYKFPPPVETPPPFNVERLKPVHPQTEKTNQAYRALLAKNGGPWQFYKLVVTQWPTTAGDPSLDGRPNHTFPGQGTDATSFANTTMETFDQKSISTGCMNCHTRTKASSDFLWSLNTRAWPSVLAVATQVAAGSPSITSLSLPRTRSKTLSGAFPTTKKLSIPQQQLDEFQALKDLMQSAENPSGK